MYICTYSRQRARGRSCLLELRIFVPMYIHKCRLGVRLILDVWGRKCKMTMDTLQGQGITPCRQTVIWFRGHYRMHGSIPQKRTETVLQLIDAVMMVNDETTAKELKILLQQHGMVVSVRTILRGRRSLGWSFRGLAYYQLICDVNKVNRLEWVEDVVMATWKLL